MHRARRVGPGRHPGRAERRTSSGHSPGATRCSCGTWSRRRWKPAPWTRSTVSGSCVGRPRCRRDWRRCWRTGSTTPTPKPSPCCGCWRCASRCDIDALVELAGEHAIDAAEKAQLIRIDRDGPALNARISHPLYGDVVLRQIGTASARMLRGQIVTVLNRHQPTSAAGRIRLAQLYLDSDQTAETGLLVAAAKDAVSLANAPLGERLARTAFERDYGMRAAHLLSRALLWQGRPDEADEILARFDPDDLDEVQLVLWGIPRASIVFWSLGEVTRTHEVMQLLRTRVSNPTLRPMVDAADAAFTIFENKLPEGLATAEAVLANPGAPEQAVETCGVRGRAGHAGGRPWRRLRGDRRTLLRHPTIHRWPDPDDGPLRRGAGTGVHRRAGQGRKACGGLRRVLVIWRVSRVGGRQDDDGRRGDLPGQVRRGDPDDRTGAGRAQRGELTAVATAGPAAAGPRLRRRGPTR